MRDNINSKHIWLHCYGAARRSVSVRFKFKLFYAVECDRVLNNNIISEMGMMHQLKIFSLHRAGYFLFSRSCVGDDNIKCINIVYNMFFFNR